MYTSLNGRQIKQGFAWNLAGSFKKTAWKCVDEYYSNPTALMSVMTSGFANCFFETYAFHWYIIDCSLLRTEDLEYWKPSCTWVQKRGSRGEFLKNGSMTISINLIDSFNSKANCSFQLLHRDNATVIRRSWSWETCLESRRTKTTWRAI